AQRDEAAGEARQQVHARDPRVLAVGLDERRGLPALDLAPAEGTEELDKPEVADEPAVVAPEPLKADDSERPGADAALAAEARRHRLGRELVQSLELERPADAHERGRPAGMQAERAQPRRRQCGEVARRRRQMERAVS